MDKIIEQITQLAQGNDDIAVLWLYGSRAKNTARNNSDYDIAIAFNNFAMDDDHLRPHILAADWQHVCGLPESGLSIVDINKVPSYLAMSILDEGKVLVEKDSLRLAHEELRIMNQYEFLRFDSVGHL